MLVEIKNEFLFTLANNKIIYNVDTFLDNGVEYVKSIQIVENIETISSMNKDNTKESYLNDLYNIHKLKDPYLAVKDLKNYINAVYQNSIVKVIETGSLN